MTPTIEEIAGRLSEAQREDLALLSGDWQAGPDLPGTVISEIKQLRDMGLIDREFGVYELEKMEPEAEAGEVEFAACWWFRLTPLGLAVGDHLLAGGGDE